MTMEEVKEIELYKEEYNSMINEIYGSGYGCLIRMLNEQTKINEGLIYTYPSNKVINSLKKIGIDDIEIIDGDNITNERIVIHLPYNKYDWFYNRIIQHMDKCGWFEALKQNNTNEILIVFEAKFDKDVTDFVYKNRKGILYHVTPSIYLKKIFKYGLMPKTYLKLANHPNRVYFTMGEHMARELIPILYSTIQDDLYKYLINEYSLLKIDLNKLSRFNSKPRFYLDPDCKSAVYTHESINPNCIDILNKFNLK